MAIFILLNGMGLAFLLYVLVNFQKEWRQLKSDVDAYEVGEGRNVRPALFAGARVVSRGAEELGTVIPFQRHPVGEKTDRFHFASKTAEMPKKRLSAS